MRLTEADLKSAVTDYLQYQMNLGKLWFTRLNSGEAFVKKGSKFHKIQLCPEGTSDLLVIKGRFMEDGRRFGRPRVHFIELKSARGKQSPAQGAFQKLVETQGASYFVIRSVEELEEILN